MRTAIRSISTGESSGGWLSHSDDAETKPENGVLKEEVARLNRDAEKTRKQVGRSDSDILMYSAIEALLQQAKELSTLIYHHQKQRDELRDPRR